MGHSQRSVSSDSNTLASFEEHIIAYWRIHALLHRSRLREAFSIGKKCYGSERVRDRSMAGHIRRMGGGRW